ncbi:MAG: cell division protein ZapA, partial [bacterium]
RQMRAVEQNGRVPGIDRCAIMAGLNISHELLALRQRAADEKAAVARLARLNQRIDDALADLRADDPQTDSESDSDSDL